ncbi:MAG: hypothetical protein A2Y07_02735 [Planctomycetes bacterium GWF2_50_10]|nr:MAG: hypothetical protein A2Y07_02735 [Planctomycetes bacterium GWF2_50_10]
MTRVVVTGTGAITALGLTSTELWQGIKQGKCGITPITSFDPAGFPTKIGGQAPDYKIGNYVPKSYRKATKLMNRDIELAVIASKEAIDSSGLITKGVDETKINIDSSRVATEFGAGFMCCDLPELGPAVEKAITDGVFDIKKWGADGLSSITPLWLLKYLPNMLGCHVSIIHDFQGPNNSITCAEVSSHMAMAEAAQVITRGWADIALTGGGEGKMHPMSIMRQCIEKRTSTKYNDTPDKACRPFDSAADGSVFGEGAGVIVMESLDYALKRGAKILGEVLGFGHSHSLEPTYLRMEPEGTGIACAIEQALAQAGITPSQIDLIIPCGSAIPHDDLAESHGIESVFGPLVKDIPALPTKSMLANTSAASGTLDAIIALNIMNESFIPAAKNCDSLAPGVNLNINTKPLTKDVKHVLCTGYTYGGQTAAFVLKKWEGK